MQERGYHRLFDFSVLEANGFKLDLARPAKLAIEDAGPGLFAATVAVGLGVSDEFAGGFGQPLLFLRVEEDGRADKR